MGRFISKLQKMTTYIDPKSLGLQPRTIVEKINKNTVAIVLHRKSRVIMADGRKLLEKAAKIKEATSGSRVMLKTNAPICSKTLKFLSDQGIEVIRG